MKLLVVLAVMFGMAIAATTTNQWSEHDCRIDHREHHSDPHKYEVSDLAGNWEQRWCHPRHLVFVLAEKCYCGWPEPDLSNSRCAGGTRPSLVHLDLDYMFEYWNTVDNVWKESNCHDIFPPGFAHNNQYLFYNVTGCRCDWKPGHPRYEGPPVTPDCTLDVDIEMNQSPPVDAEDNFVELVCPVWPPTVNVTNMGGRECIRGNDCILKSLYLAGSEKKDACMYFGLYSTANDNPSNYLVVLGDSCVTFPASFLFEYRASSMSFRVTYHGGVWTYSPGGSGVDRWVDVALCYRTGSWFTIYEGGSTGSVVVDPTPNPPPVPFMLDCPLAIYGDPLNADTKYTGCIDWFQEIAGGDCPVDLRP